MLRQLDLLGGGAAAGYDADPAVSIRASNRAKRLTLRVVPPYDLELVVPRGTRPGLVEDFLKRNRDWIRRAKHELQVRYPPTLRALPRSIELRAIGTLWQVETEIDRDLEPRLDTRADRLLLRVPSDDSPEGFELLRQWLLREGRRHLKPWLVREGTRLGLVPERIQIRTQRTRWGSCSQLGGVSLNAALLLLSEELVRYLFVHELCHLRHLNHSRRYWQLVERFDPAYRAHDRALASAWTEIPRWALPR